MLVSGLPMVVIASVIVHNTKPTIPIRSYTHQCDLPPEQPLTLKVDWVGNPVALLDTRPAVASS